MALAEELQALSASTIVPTTAASTTRSCSTCATTPLRRNPLIARISTHASLPDTLPSMCGRLVQDLTDDQLRDVFSSTREGGYPFRRTWNLAPMQPMVVIGARDGRRIARALRWGLVPSWCNDAAQARAMAAKCINARAEGVAARPAFRAAFAKRRCLVPASGFYEWARVSAKEKVPHYLCPADGGLWGLAGLWERWTDPSTGEELRTATILTTTPNTVAARVHDRMPVILGRDAWDAWLSPSTPANELEHLLVPCPAAWVAERVVSTAVNSTRKDGPELTAPAVE